MNDTMSPVVIEEKPVDRVRSFISDYARQLYGIDNASALMPLVEIAFDGNQRPSERIAASRELLRYSEVPTRSIEYDSGKSGPDFSLTILGTCEIEEPQFDAKPSDSKQLAPPDTSGSTVELHDAGREESSVCVAPEGGEG